MRNCAASWRSSTCSASPPINHSVWLALSTITCRLARSSVWACSRGQGVSTLCGLKISSTSLPVCAARNWRSTVASSMPAVGTNTMQRSNDTGRSGGNCHSNTSPGSAQSVLGWQRADTRSASARARAGACSAPVACAHNTARRQSTMRMSAASSVGSSRLESRSSRSICGRRARGVRRRRAGRSWPAPISGWRTTHTTAPTAKITPHHTMSARSQPKGSALAAVGVGLAGSKSSVLPSRQLMGR